MANLVKTEWYKLRTSKMFYILLAVVFTVNTAAAAIMPTLEKLFSPNHQANKVELSNAIASPFIVGLLMIVVFISAVSFLYSDFSGGYIKNIAGQVGNKGNIVISKFIVIGIHNLIFLAVGALSNVLGNAIAGQLLIDSDIFPAILTLLIKWLLSMSISAILLFMTMGMKSKTFASILGVVFATGTLSIVYLGLNNAISNIFHVAGFDLAEFAPDTLMSTVNVMKNALVINAIIVSVVFIAIFISLTYMTFKKRDVK